MLQQQQQQLTDLDCRKYDSRVSVGQAWGHPLTNAATGPGVLSAHVLHLSNIVRNAHWKP